MLAGFVKRSIPDLENERGSWRESTEPGAMPRSPCLGSSLRRFRLLLREASQPSWHCLFPARPAPRTRPAAREADAPARHAIRPGLRLQADDLIAIARFRRQ